MCIWKRKNCNQSNNHNKLRPIYTINHFPTSNGVFRIFILSRDFAINLYKLIRLQIRKGYSTTIE